MADQIAEAVRDERKRIAEIVAGIIGTADGGCTACVRDLCQALSESAIGYTFTPREDENGNSVWVSSYHRAVDATPHG